MRDDIYYQYNPWWEGDLKGGFIERGVPLQRMEHHLGGREIVFLTGLRRVGKTTLMKLCIKKLIDRGVKPKNIFYVSLDDFLLEKKTIIDVIDDYRKLHRLGLEERVYLFLDEITHKELFHQQLKNLYDKQDVKIFASSSSSSLLKDKSAFLTGREVVIEVLPLDFDEYCLFKRLRIKKSEGHLRETFFDDYLKTGGMPEFVLKQDREYLTTLVDDIIYKDIVAFHGIKSSHGIREFFTLLMERAGKQASINKMAKILDISPDTAKRYLSLFEETYLVYPVLRSGTTNESILSPKKIYAADLGIRCLFTGLRDKGALFENYVYLLIRQSSPRYVKRGDIEIDFLTRNGVLIEVKYGGEMTKKQSDLFQNIKAEKKFIVKGLEDLSELISGMGTDIKGAA